MRAEVASASMAICAGQLALSGTKCIEVAVYDSGPFNTESRPSLRRFEPREHNGSGIFGQASDEMLEKKIDQGF